MPTLLQIRSSIIAENSQSNALMNAYTEAWKVRTPEGQIIVRDLAAEPLPVLDSATLGALMTAADERSAEQQVVVALSDQLIEEVRTADQILIGIPMYNFGIPVQLKAWFDLLARAGVTFKYTETGPVGLLPDTPVVMFATRGGIYHANGQDYQMPYVEQFLAFIGLTQTETVFAEGLNMGQAETAKAAAQRQIAALV
ncbi:NAD(P)H-dependent oxidoreductase [Neptuniibacter sp. CAU 1671]|uniref:FMN-dependent NADH-azoreductase n=1 Tax=Neptuniibacter sp. CAU 1671 TaxID=3032593 RepID=UPI0023D9B88C|nr:NAD(P)H-dependent oxidoreductase [Neptuniibacter sp. CAU 1671]MDF2181157.1 NAD(P)H-dependent oxidoreductase [Neptuniibacter sp. CAU 1671]